MMLAMYTIPELIRALHDGFVMSLLHILEGLVNRLVVEVLIRGTLAHQ